MNMETLQRISYLFKEQRHLRGKILIRKREKSPFIFFVKKGEVEVRFPYTEYDISVRIEKNGEESVKKEGLNKEHNYFFAKINAGGYFNLSSSLLNKFSIFEFVVSSTKADLLLLSTEDLLSQAKKSEDLFFALESH